MTEYELQSLRPRPIGVCFQTWNHKLTNLYFVSPPINSKGDDLREKLDEWREFSDSSSKDENLDEKAFTKKFRKMMLGIIISSLKFQYKIRKKEESGGFKEVDSFDDCVIVTGKRFFVEILIFG